MLTIVKRLCSILTLAAIILTSDFRYVLAQEHPYTVHYRYSERKLASLANHGDATAAFYLGLRYRDYHQKVVDDFVVARLKDVPGDPAKASKWFHKAADLGYHNAVNETSLGEFYTLQPSFSLTESRFWLERASAHGSAAASADLARLYRSTTIPGSASTIATASQYEALSKAQWDGWVQMQSQNDQDNAAAAKASDDAARAHQQAIINRLNGITQAIVIAGAAVGVDATKEDDPLPETPISTNSTSSSKSTKTSSSSSSNSSADDYCKGHHAPSGNYCDRALSDEAAKAAYCYCPK